MRVSPKLVLVVVVLAAAGGAYYLWQGKGDAGDKQVKIPVQTVKTAVAVKTSIPVTVLANGYVTAINTIDVRPQVQNVVRAVHVTEGQDVKAGQLLFTLDERSDSTNVDKARAQVARDRADLADAEIAYKRNQELFAKGFVAQSVVDSARNKVESLRGTLNADQAGLAGGQVTAGFNRILAGISGRIGAISVHPSSLAQPAGASLVTISQLDPITVSFSVPEAQLSFIRASYPNGDAPVTVQIPGGRELTGKLNFIDNAVDQGTGSIKMKALFANPDKLLWPGSFVNVSMISHTLDNVVAIPPQAVVTGPNDKFVYLVQPDSTIKRLKVDVGAIENGQAAVSGVPAGARVVIEGAQNLRPNSTVREMGAAPGKGGKPPEAVAAAGAAEKNSK
jgi:RND family efflux transporter MFP subunit